MGKNNRQRRAKKKKDRSNRQQTKPQGNKVWCGDCREFHTDFDQPEDASNPFNDFSTDELISSLFRVMTKYSIEKDVPAYQQTKSMFVERFGPVDAVTVIEGELDFMVDAVWKIGWQPSELCRQIKRSTNVFGEQTILAAIAADHFERPDETLHPEWNISLAELDLPKLDAKSGWLKSVGADHKIRWADMVDELVKVFGSLSSLTPLPELVPPPGTQGASTSLIDLSGDVAEPALKKVRALLIKAESTEFEEEAHAFTVKAHELMARHSIDQALLNATSQTSAKPISVRIPIDNPYSEQKTGLLNVVALNYRCRLVSDPQYGLATLVGFRSDVSSTETLFTSLLLQAQGVIQKTAHATKAGSRERSRRYKASFLPGLRRGSVNG